MEFLMEKSKKIILYLVNSKLRKTIFLARKFFRSYIFRI